MAHAVWLLRAALRPWEAFGREEGPLGPALGRMLAWRLPFALAGAWLGLRATAASLGQLQRMEGPMGDLLRGPLAGSVAPEDLREALAALPTLPDPGPWLLVAVPLGLLGAWFHHGVWDHVGLWLLRGLGEKRGARATLLAEARAVEVGAVGAALGLLGFLPGIGPWLGLPLGLVGLWFWLLRGFALAAQHGCPAWKGVGATVLHALLFAGCSCLLLGLSLVLALGLAAS